MVFTQYTESRTGIQEAKGKRVDVVYNAGHGGLGTYGTKGVLIFML